MTTSVAKVSGTAQSGQHDTAGAQASPAAAIRAQRNEIMRSQERKNANLASAMKKERNVSDFPSSANVKLSKALKAFMSQQALKKKDHGYVEQKTTARAQTGERLAKIAPPQAASDVVARFFDRMEGIRIDENRYTSLDSLRGAIERPPPSRDIDVLG